MNLLLNPDWPILTLWFILNNIAGKPSAVTTKPKHPLVAGAEPDLHADLMSEIMAFTGKRARKKATEDNSKENLCYLNSIMSRIVFYAVS